MAEAERSERGGGHDAPTSSGKGAEPAKPAEKAAAAEGAGGPSSPPVEGGVDEKELEQETCGFCKFMKAGPCGTVFKEWEACIDKHKDAGGDYVENCLEPTRFLKECMDRNQAYYNPVLELDKEDQEGEEEGAQTKQGEGGEGDAGAGAAQGAVAPAAVAESATSKPSSS